MRRFLDTGAYREQGCRPACEAKHHPQQPEEHLVSLLAPRSFEAEQYRVLGHVIEQMRKDVDLHVIAVTSPAVGDGKTTTAINLAGTLAQGAHTRVLIIDGDLRRPSVGVQFRLLDPDVPGLVDAILKPGVGLSDVVQHFPQFNLSIVAAGRCDDNPYEVLKSEQLAEVLLEARGAYDYVVIDTPPLVPLPDCRAIAKWIDGFVMIVAAHKTPQRLLEEALGIVEPSKLLGIVFNRNDRPMSDSYGYYGAYLQPMNGHRAPWWWRGRRRRAA
jgi:capsular exopolysaccharide synthesis family protein